MGVTKRHETTSLRSSSSRRNSVSPAPTSRHVQTANVGCMSGIFQLVSNYHTRRKFLTFGRRQERPAPPSPKPETVTSPSRDKVSSSLETPRSPAIPTEIRNSGSASLPRVVARLMGLDDIPANLPETVAAESAAEKRRKLMGALEKCDEDLKALKRIIESVRGTQTPPRVMVVDEVCGGKRVSREKNVEEREEEEEEVGSDEPSPVSVLTRSPPLTGYYSKRTGNGQILQLQQQFKQQQRQHMITKKKPSLVMAPQSLNLPTRPSRRVLNTSAATTSSRQCSVAMRESVTEVCRNVTQGQRREVGMIGLLIQDFIYKDLVDEIIKELGGLHVYRSPLSLPFEACKRQLCF